MRYRKRELVLLTIILFLSFLAEVRSQTARSGQPPVTADERLEARERLAELGYWLDPERDPPGGQFRQALIAFQKVGGHPRTGIGPIYKTLCGAGMVACVVYIPCGARKHHTADSHS